MERGTYTHVAFVRARFHFMGLVFVTLDRRHGQHECESQRKDLPLQKHAKTVFFSRRGQVLLINLLSQKTWCVVFSVVPPVGPLVCVVVLFDLVEDVVLHVASPFVWVCSR
jgi:hypothetical protein